MAKYYIYGHEVDKKTYEKYANKTFSVGGMELSMSTLRVWATSKEIDEELPDEAATARKIYQEILSDIGAVGAVETPKTAHKTFREYIDDVNNIYKQHSAERKKLLDRVEKAKQEYNEILHDSSGNSNHAIAAQGRYAQASIDLEKDLRALQNSYTEQVREARAGLANLVESVYRATPDKVDDKSVQLINSGIMSVSDLEHMAMQFRHNPTMLKLIARHCHTRAEEMRAAGKHKDGTKMALLAKTLEAAEKPEIVFEGFDMLAKRGEASLTKNASKNADEYWAIIYSEICANYDDFIIQADTSYKRKDSTRRA